MITVYPATRGDIPVLAQFNTAMALETEHKVLADSLITPGVTRIVEDPSLGFYIKAMSGSEIVGCLAITYEWSDWRNGNFWWIQSVYVHPGYRRLGVFRAMYDYIMTKAQSTADCCGIRLYVEKDNLRAQQTYQDLGMIETDYRLFEVEFTHKG